MRKKASPASYGSKSDSYKSFKEGGKSGSSGRSDKPYKKSSERSGADSAFGQSREDKGRKKPYGSWGASEDDKGGKRAPYGSRSAGPGAAGDRKKPYSGRTTERPTGDKPSHFDRPDRKTRPFESRDGGKKSFDSDRPARPPRDNDRSDRPARPYEKKDDRKNSFGDRPARPSRDNDRPARPPRDGGRSDGPDRPYERKSDDKPRRSGDSEKSSRPYPKRQDRDFKGSDRPQRSAGKETFKKTDKPYDKEKPARNNFSDKDSYKTNESDEAPEKIKTAFKTPHKFKRGPLEQAAIPEFEESAPKPKKRRKPKEEEDDEDDEVAVDNQPMPLNKYIAHSGECSRRDAGELVKQGKVKVNGELIMDPGYRVQEMDQVTLLGKKLTPTKGRAYVLVNKPKGFITTTEDPQERKTIMDLVNNTGIERLYPVGRLDRNTSGLLLMTNDGDLAQKLSHPSYNIKKVYQVTLDRPITKADFDKVIEGVTLEDGIAHVDTMAQLEEKNELGLEIHSGRNRVVRRIFESMGYVVEKLDRVMYAGLTKKNLPRGKWRFLTEEEVIHLKHFKS